MDPPRLRAGGRPEPVSGPGAMIGGSGGDPAAGWARRNRVAVLGIGNPLFGDDGVGIELVARLAAEPLPEHVELLDGGAYGLFLLPFVVDARSLVVCDAIDVGEAPGTVVVIDGDDLPHVLRRPLSAHQVDLLDVLSAARLMGRVPDVVTIIGVQPASLAFGWGLHSEVRAALPLAITYARRLIATGARRPAAGCEHGGESGRVRDPTRLG